MSSSRPVSASTRCGRCSTCAATSRARSSPPARRRSISSSSRKSSQRWRHEAHAVRPRGEQAGRAHAHHEHVRAPRLQHRQPRGRPDRTPRRLARHHPRRLRVEPARADREADAQARERPPRRRARPRRVDRARARAHEGLGAAREARRADGARRGLRRARRRSRPRPDRLRAHRAAGGRGLLRGARPPARPAGARPHRAHRPRPRPSSEPKPSSPARAGINALRCQTPFSVSDTGLTEGEHVMATIYREGDLDLLSGKVAVIGYGSQGHAHALNLRDSGVDVQVGLREGSPSKEKAEDAGLEVRSIPEAVRGAQVVALLLPDHVQKQVWDEEIAPNLEPGAAVLFAHGLNVHFERIAPPEGHDVIMVAPKAPGHRVRELYVSGAGTPGLVAVHRDASGSALDLALAYGVGIGCARVGLLATTFAEETESDLFGEQAVLCGGVPALVQAGFDVLVEAGYQPEIAYYECLNEPKLIVDLVYQGGYEYMRYSVSDVAEYGDLSRGPRVVDDAVKERLRDILGEIQTGAFAQELFADDEAGRPKFAELRKAGEERAAEIERVGKELRALAGVEGLLGVR